MQNAHIVHHKLVKIGGFFFFFVLALLLMREGFHLLDSMKHVDGAGIGVYFLFFEINDRVLTSDIQFYAIGFFVAGFAAIIAPFVLFHHKVLKYIISVWS